MHGQNHIKFNGLALLRIIVVLINWEYGGNNILRTVNTEIF